MTREVDLEKFTQSEWKTWEEGVRFRIHLLDATEKAQAIQSVIGQRALDAWDLLHEQFVELADDRIKAIAKLLPVEKRSKKSPIVKEEIEALLVELKAYLQVRSRLEPMTLGLAMVIACVDDWDGYVAKDGTPIPCTAKNRAIIFAHEQDAANFVSAEYAKMQGEAIAKKKAKTKNSKRSHATG